jgi:hypothetical protein
MTTPQTGQVDLARSFSAVTRALKANQASLNASDEYNHNHGDNMVKNFQVITTAMRQKKDAAPSEQLQYASQALAKRANSGSAQMYAQGLSQAAERLQGQRGIDANSMITLVQALMGGGQASAPAPASAGGMGDLLGSLLGGGATAQPTQPQSAGGLGDLLGSLLGGEPQQQSTPQQSGGLDMGTLLSAGMAFLQARQQGQDVLPALVQAIVSGSQMSNSAHHNQSGTLVASTLLNTIGGMLGGKK